ncbi:annexin A2-like isoform X2 [Dunckerocampus dactyliophorus]|uniref:annexin A2-like isoform X2 n=1 Tax=Dunckerocampus dactyliophorus TaxID=161453 RepID=UPI0024055E91|nr:annexin A2-like isoform X2 [Dunckerocampus dactyliophorus]
MGRSLSEMTCQSLGHRERDDVLHEALRYATHHGLRDRFLPTGHMALVSEFLGQLTLAHSGEAEPTFPTVVPLRDFDPAKDAARLDAALRVKGVDEQTIIDILTRRTYEQRREIAFDYERLAKKDLVVALKGALSGSLEALMLGLMKSPTQYDAFELKASMKGLGTDEETLIEIVCSRNNEELAQIKKVYRETFKKELDKDVAGDTSGDFAKLLLALVQTRRDEPSNVVDYQKIDDDAKSLYEAGVKRKGTDVSVWISILTQRSVPHLQRVFERYNSYSPYDLKESIRKEVKGDLEKSFLTLVECLENKQLYFANRLNEAMKGKGAKEKVLTRILVSRCQVDLMKIRSVFKKQHRRSLYQTIIVRTHTSSSFSSWSTSSSHHSNPHSHPYYPHPHHPPSHPYHPYTHSPHPFPPHPHPPH